MTLDEINRAIAEKVGWRFVKVSADGLDDGCWLPPGALHDAAVFEHCEKSPPRYSSSLDALHEALQSLTEIELFRYADEVCDLTCDSNHDTDIQTMLMLSAKELAECYVRAIGKWRDA